MARRIPKKATKKAPKKVAKKTRTPRVTREETFSLSTTVQKTVRVDVPRLVLPRRCVLGDHYLTLRLSGEPNGGFSDYRNINMLFKDDHIHAQAGCQSVFRLMSKSDYQAFRKWADSHFNIK